MSFTMPSNLMDGVARCPLNGIQVIIIGAGNGGLYAALECWRKDCDVVVPERTQEISRLGDFFTITPSALTTLHRYPQMLKQYHEKVYNCSTHIFTPSGRAVKSVLPEWKREGVTHAAPDVNVSFLNLRRDFARLQFEQCERLGIEIKFGIKGEAVDETGDGVVVHTDRGDFKADVCIAADAIGSKIRWPTRGGLGDIQDSGYAVTRVAFPLETLETGSPAERMVKDALTHGLQVRTDLGNDVHLILFLTLGNIACLVEQASPDADPGVLDFLRQTPTLVVDWRLMWRDSDPHWTSDDGRIVKLGDTAHAFFPTAGNGAVQAVEDGLSLAECLRIGGKSNVSWSTKVHNKLRYQRVSILQQTGFLNREELHFADLHVMELEPEKHNSGFFKIGRWVWDHDPEAYATRNHAKALDSVEDGKQFENTNLPPGHVFQKWTMKEEMERMKAGRKSDLKSNGYWGI